MKFLRSNDAEMIDPQASSVVSYTSEPFPTLLYSHPRDLNRFIAQIPTVTRRAAPGALRYTLSSTSPVSMMRYVFPASSYEWTGVDY